MYRAFPFGLEYLLDLVGDSIYLSAAFGGTEDEVVGEVADLSDVKQNYVGGLFLGCSLYGLAR